MIFVNPDTKVNRDVPNVGLAYMATHFGTKVMDQNTTPSPEDRFLRYETNVLGISAQFRTYGESQSIAKLCKRKYPKAKIKSISGFLDIQCCCPYLDLKEKIIFNEPFSDRYPFPNYELFDSFDVFEENWRRGIVEG